jgi:hypothetical protein
MEAANWAVPGRFGGSASGPAVMFMRRVSTGSEWRSTTRTCRPFGSARTVGRGSAIGSGGGTLGGELRSRAHRSAAERRIAPNQREALTTEITEVH